MAVSNGATPSVIFYAQNQRNNVYTRHGGTTFAHGAAVSR